MIPIPWCLLVDGMWVHAACTSCLTHQLISRACSAQMQMEACLSACQAREMSAHVVIYMCQRSTQSSRCPSLRMIWGCPTHPFIFVCAKFCALHPPTTIAVLLTQAAHCRVPCPPTPTLYFLTLYRNVINTTHTKLAAACHNYSLQVFDPTCINIRLGGSASPTALVLFFFRGFESHTKGCTDPEGS